MKRIFGLFVIFLLSSLMVFSLFACTGVDEPTLPSDNNPNASQDGGNNPDASQDGGNNPDEGGTKASIEGFNAIKALGYDTDYQTFQSIVSNDLALALPSKNGSISIQEYEDTLFKSKMHDGNKYIFEARPDYGYYFEGWEAYDYEGKSIDVAQKTYVDDTERRIFCNVIGDYRGYNSPVRFVRAIFTNDEQKLVDTQAVRFEELGEVDALLNTSPPDKIVKGTLIYQLVRPKEGYYITEWSSFYPRENETIPGTEIGYGGDIVSGSLFLEDYLGLVFEYNEEGVVTGKNNTFGTPAQFNITTRSASDIAPVYLHVSHLYPYEMDGSEGLYFPKPQNHSNPKVIFVDRNKPLYLEPSLQYMGDSFYGWYDWEGNLLTRNYVYTDLNFDEDVLYLSVRFATLNEHLYEGFTEHDEYFRYNPINNGTAWEVIYNYENTKYVDVLTIPQTFKGLPVSKIANRGFAKFWLRTDDPHQWWFTQAHPKIGRLVVPASILEVGDFAFATVHKNVSTSSLTEIAEDTDGDHWTDTYTDVTFEVEFLSINTRVTPFTFSQSGHKFINAWGQMEQVLNTLLHTYISGVYALELEILPNLSVESHYSVSNPFAIKLSSQICEEGEGKMYFSLLREFRHFMQMVAVGAIEGATLKTDLGEAYETLLQQNLDNYISSGQSGYQNQFIEQDANAFAYSFFCYSVKYSGLLVSA